MRYNIVHLIRGEAKETHERLTTELSEKFSVFPLHERIPPHLTLKRGFESDEVDMVDLYHRLEEFATSQKTSDYVLSGWGSFPEKAIYIDVDESPQMSDTVASLLNCIRDMPGMHLHEYDNGAEFHASVAMTALGEFDFNAVWDYLHTIDFPNYSLQFDNITTLKKEGEVWVVDRVFELLA